VTSEIVILTIGFLFLTILILYLALLPILGYVIGSVDYDSDAELLKISKSPNKFKLSIIIALIHDIFVIILAVLLFIAFSSYNTILGIIWVIFRTGEGLVLIYNERIYWRLLNIAEKYSNVSTTEKKEIIKSSNSIFETRNTKFSLGMSLWAIGTLAFSIMIVISVIIPSMIGWLGIIASIAVGLYNGALLIKNNEYKILMAGGLVAIVFEIIIGGWLILYGYTPL
jgi:hypothetical protein